MLASAQQKGEMTLGGSLGVGTTSNILDGSSSTNVTFGIAGIAGGGIVMPGFGVGLNLGSFEFRPTNKFGVSINLLSFSYALLTYKDEYFNSKSNAVNFNLGLSPSVGIKYYF